ncbi:hypothetical protein MMC09_005524 [Bachmanniomyces sp. S44760]|nr:hypothetical protein [Bachmanniomyces sp. S44760]
MAEPAYDLEAVRREERRVRRQATIDIPNGPTFNIVRQPLPHRRVDLSLYRAIARQTFRNQNNQSKIKRATALYFERVIRNPAPGVPSVPAVLGMPGIPALPAVPDHPRRLLYQTYNAQLLDAGKPTLTRQLAKGVRNALTISPAMTSKAEIAQVLGDFMGIEVVIIRQQGNRRDVVCRGNHNGPQIFLLHTVALNHWDELSLQPNPSVIVGDFRYTAHKKRLSRMNAQGRRNYLDERASIKQHLRHNMRRPGFVGPALPLESPPPMVTIFIQYLGAPAARALLQRYFNLHIPTCIFLAFS